MLHPTDASNSLEIREIPLSYLPLIEMTGFIGEPTVCYSDHLEKNDALINCRGKLTSLGEVLTVTLPDKTFFDLGCGSPEYSKVPMRLARQFSSRSYVGVEGDLDCLPFSAEHSVSPVFSHSVPRRYLLREQMNLTFSEIQEKLPVQYFGDDVLGFLAKLPALNHGAVFLFSGIDPLSGPVFSYVKAVIAELARLTHRDDIVIINDAFSGMLQRFLEESGEWDYMTEERKSYYTIVLRKK